MFLNILRILASNVFKTFLNIIVSIGRTLVIFHSHKPTGSINSLYGIPWPGEYKLNTHNAIDVVAMRNIRRETNCFHNLAQYPKQKFFAFQFLSLGTFLACSYILGIFQPHVLIKRFL